MTGASLARAAHARVAVANAIDAALLLGIPAWQIRRAVKSISTEQPPWEAPKLMGWLTSAAGFVEGALSGCGASPGFKLMGLGVRYEESGAEVSLREATLRALLLRAPRLIVERLTKTGTERRPAGGLTEDSKRQLHQIHQEHLTDAQGREAALEDFYKEHQAEFSAQRNRTLSILAIALATGLIRRRLERALPKTMIVRERD